MEPVNIVYAMIESTASDLSSDHLAVTCEEGETLQDGAPSIKCYSGLGY